MRGGWFHFSSADLGLNRYSKRKSHFEHTIQTISLLQSAGLIESRYCRLLWAVEAPLALAANWPHVRNMLVIANRRLASLAGYTARRFSSSTTYNFDVIVVGNGLVGSASACQIGSSERPSKHLRTSLDFCAAASCPQLSVALVGSGKPLTKEKVSNMSSPDIRVFAITSASAQALNGKPLLISLDQ